MSITAAVDRQLYMASREWRLKRKEVMDRAEGICERCHDADISDVHHLSYERLGNEEPDRDLLGVCRPCHEYLSAERADDPAKAVVLSLIERTGLQFELRRPGHWDEFLWWTTGPTSKGDYFHGELKPTPTVDPARSSVLAYMDSAIVVVEVQPGIWYHCTSY